MMPRPFARGVFIFGDPITVDKDLDDAGIEDKRGQLEKVLNDLTERADTYFSGDGYMSGGLR